MSTAIYPAAPLIAPAANVPAAPSPAAPTDCAVGGAILAPIAIPAALGGIGFTAAGVAAHQLLLL